MYSRSTLRRVSRVSRIHLGRFLAIRVRDPIGMLCLSRELFLLLLVVHLRLGIVIWRRGWLSISIRCSCSRNCRSRSQTFKSLKLLIFSGKNSCLSLLHHVLFQDRRILIAIIPRALQGNQKRAQIHQEREEKPQEETKEQLQFAQKNKEEKKNWITISLS